MPLYFSVASVPSRLSPGHFEAPSDCSEAPVGCGEAPPGHSEAPPGSSMHNEVYHLKQELKGSEDANRNLQDMMNRLFCIQGD